MERPAALPGVIRFSELEVYGTTGPTNVAPTANAGADKSVTLPTNSTVINGSASDTDGTISSYSWTQMSGPSTATLSGANTANLTASTLIQGTYVFRLTATDNGGLTGSDNVNVVVNPASSGSESRAEQTQRLLLRRKTQRGQHLVRWMETLRQRDGQVSRVILNGSTWISVQRQTSIV